MNGSMANQAAIAGLSGNAQATALFPTGSAAAAALSALNPSVTSTGASLGASSLLGHPPAHHLQHQQAGIGGGIGVGADYSTTAALLQLQQLQQQIALQQVASNNIDSFIRKGQNEYKLLFDRFFGSKSKIKTKISKIFCTQFLIESLLLEFISLFLCAF